MKTLFFDLPMGAAGDMLSAALYELLSDKEKTEFLKELNEAGIPGVEVSVEKTVKCGITGTHFVVKVNGEEEVTSTPLSDHEHEHHHEHQHEHEHHHEQEHEHHHEHHHHHHTSMSEIEQLISDLKISDSVKKNVVEVYKLIAGAESSAHGVPVTDIHFHEVGTMDAVADITAVCLLMEKIGVQKVCASAVNVGSGQVHCAHGILPVPAPATAFILKEVPVYSGHITGELCTPTGAALLKHFVTDFGSMPSIRMNAIGYGMGKKDFEAANCVRAILGETEENAEQILEFKCNLDDISAEKLSFAMEQLFEAGAIEVYTIPIVMKKSRAGQLLCVMCREALKEKILETIFKHTTTLGIRETRSNRYYLEREVETVKTEFGEIRIKKAKGYGVERYKPEYEDLAAVSRKTGLSIDEVTARLSLLTKNGF